MKFKINYQKIIKKIINKKNNIIKALYIFLISAFLTLYSMKYIRNNYELIKQAFIGRLNNLTYFEYILVFAIIVVLAYFIPLLTLKVKGNSINSKVSLSCFLLMWDCFLIDDFISRGFPIDSRTVNSIYLNIFMIVWYLVDLIIIIYYWLWETTYYKGNKIKKKYRKLNIKKLSLLWAIIIFILGILFNYKK